MIKFDKQGEPVPLEKRYRVKKRTAKIVLRRNKIVASDGHVFKCLPRSWELWEGDKRVGRWEKRNVLEVIKNG